MDKPLRLLLSDPLLVKNLYNPEDVDIILGGCSTLEERFEKIDNRMVVEN